MMEEKGRGRTRCAIYTRKSTEEGLDQAFNTLDAQREACEAYIKSQAGEGWRPLPDRYDDGGYSGGNMNRPAIQRLLTDVEAGKVDVIVVYKVDRLTRSLMDFARIVERLDARGVSFVSVTQAFNTTTSMGRLTLNVLLSFAQFEREVTGERIRDKVAASKARGMWMGGNVPLGYDLQDRRLVVNTAEAEQVRHIFTRYVELRSGVDLMNELREHGIVSKRWTSRSGRQLGAVPFRCGALYYLLQNRLYLGEVVHLGRRHKGQHEPIVSKELFASVQAVLAENRAKRRDRPTRVATCPLAGLVFDAECEAMKPSFSYGRGGRAYRYYVSAPLLVIGGDRSASDGKIRRVSASALEKLVQERVTRLLGGLKPVAWPAVLEILRQVELRQRSIQLVLDSSQLLDPHEPLEWAIKRLQERVVQDRIVADGDGLLRLICDRRPKFRGGDTSGWNTSAGPGVGDAPLLTKLRTAHKLLEQYRASPFCPDDNGSAEAPPYQRERRLMALGLLSPRLVRKMLQGQASEGLLSAVAAGEVPLAWSDQEALFGR